VEVLGGAPDKFFRGLVQKSSGIFAARAQRPQADAMDGKEAHKNFI